MSIELCVLDSTNLKPECSALSSFRPISDVSSDLTIEVGSSSFALHKVSNFSW